MKRQKKAFFKRFFLPAFLAFSLALSACTPATNSDSSSSNSTNVNGGANGGFNNGVVLKHQDVNEFLAVPANKQSIVEISNKFLSNFSSFIDLRQVKTAQDPLLFDLPPATDKTDDNGKKNNTSGNFFSFRKSLGVKKGIPEAKPAATTSPASTAASTPAAGSASGGGTAAAPKPPATPAGPTEATNAVVKGLQSNLTASTNLEYLVEKLSSNSNGTSGTDGSKSNESDFTKLETNLTQKQTAVKTNLKAIEAKLSSFRNSIRSDITTIERAMTEVATKSKSLPNIIKNLLTEAKDFVSTILETTSTDDATTYKLSSATGTQLFNFVSKVKTALENKNFSTANNSQTYQSFKSAYNESLNLFNQISQSLNSKSAKLMTSLNQIIDYLNSYKILQDYLNDSAKVNTNLSLGFIIASSSQASTETKLDNFRIPISNYIQAADAFISNPVGLRFFDQTNNAFSGIIYNSGSSLVGTALKSLSNDIQRFENNGKTLLFNLNLLGNDPASISKFEEILNTVVKDDYQRVRTAFLSPQNGVETIMRSIKFQAEEIQKYYGLNFARYFDSQSNNSITKTMSDLETLVNSYNNTQTDDSKKIINFTSLKNDWKKVADFFKNSVDFSKQILGTGNASQTANNFVGWSATLQNLKTLNQLGNFNVFSLLEFIKNTQTLTTSFGTATKDKIKVTTFSDLMGYTSVLDPKGKNGFHTSLLAFQTELTSKSVNDESLKNKFKELFVSLDNSTSLVGKLVQGFPVTRNGVGVETNSPEKTRFSYFVKLDFDLIWALYSFRTKTLRSLPPNDNYSSVTQALNSWLKIAVT